MANVGLVAKTGEAVRKTASVPLPRWPNQVLARTNNTQEPFIYGSLPGEELYFKEVRR